MQLGRGYHGSIAGCDRITALNWRAMRCQYAD